MELILVILILLSPSVSPCGFLSILQLTKRIYYLLFFSVLKWIIYVLQIMFKETDTSQGEFLKLNNWLSGKAGAEPKSTDPRIFSLQHWLGSSIHILFSKAAEGFKKNNNNKVIDLEPWSSNKPVGAFLWFWWPTAIWIRTRLRLVRPRRSLATPWNNTGETVSIVYSQFPNQVSNQAGLVWVFSWQSESISRFKSQVHAREQEATPFPLSFYMFHKFFL